MEIGACFLSIDEDMPLAIWLADDRGCEAISLDKFFADSKPDMSKEQAARYAAEFKKFADELQAFSEI